jgi:hypothetical protein
LASFLQQLIAQGAVHGSIRDIAPNPLSRLEISRARRGLITLTPQQHDLLFGTERKREAFTLGGEWHRYRPRLEGLSQVVDESLAEMYLRGRQLPAEDVKLLWSLRVAQYRGPKRGAGSAALVGIIAGKDRPRTLRELKEFYVHEKVHVLSHLDPKFRALVAKPQNVPSKWMKLYMDVVEKTKKVPRAPEWIAEEYFAWMLGTEKAGGIRKTVEENLPEFAEIYRARTQSPVYREARGMFRAHLRGQLGVTPFVSQRVVDEDWVEFLSKQGVKPVGETFARRAAPPGGTLLRRLWGGVKKRPLLFGAIGLGAGIGAYNLFSGKDDYYNTIEGMPHGGMAEWHRKMFTDFGSGYDRVRQIARQLQKSFSSLVKEGEFRMALARGKQLEVLGEGSFAMTTLHEATYQGHTFQFVRKKLLPSAFETVRQSENPAYYARGLDLAEEASKLRLLGTESSEVIPSVYHQFDDVLYMEHMPGTGIGKFATTLPRATIPEKARKALLYEIETVAEKGVFNPDIAARNVLYDPKSKRASWIDWGMSEDIGPSISQRSSAIQTMEDKMIAIHGLTRPHAEFTAPITRVATAPTVASPGQRRRLVYMKTMPAELAADLDRAKREIWENARSGGKRHVGYAGGHVKHSSRYSGGI